MEGSSVKLTPRGCANATVNLDAVPDYLLKADDDVRLWTTDHTHRRRLKWRNGFECRGTPFLTRKRAQLDRLSGSLDHAFETRTDNLNHFRDSRHNT
jgi:hypothetical protein